MEIFRLFGSIFINSEDALKSLNKVDKKAKSTGMTLGEMAGKFAGFALKLSGIGAAVGGALFAVAKGSSDYASQINDMSEKTQLSTDTLQELRYVCGQVGSEFGNLETATKSMINNMSSAQDGTGAQAEAFKKLGISVTNADGSLRSVDSVFDETISKLSDMQNETERAALANDLFGKAGTDMLPILALGKEGFSQLREEAHKYGAVMDKDAIQAGDKFGDSLAKIKGSAEGLKNTIGTALQGDFQKWADWIEENMPQIKQWVEDAILKIKGGIQDFLNTLNTLSPIIGGVVAAMTSYVAITKSAMIIEVLSKAWKVGQAALLLFQSGASLATVAQMAFNGALLANPIGIVVAAIGALVAIGVVLYKNWDQVSAFLVKSWEWIKTTAVNVFTGVKNFLTDTWDAISKKVTDAFGNIKTKILEIGSNIITGIVEGITNSASKVGQALMGIITGAVDGVKRFLGIKSPSKLTRDQIGLPMGQGIGDGLEDSRDNIINTLSNLGEAIIKALKSQYEEMEKTELEENKKSIQREKGKTRDLIKEFEKQRDARLKDLKESLAPQMDRIKNEISALETLTRAEEKALEEQEYMQKLANYQQAILQAENLEDRQDAQAEMAEFIAEHEREALLEQREIKINAYETELKALEDKLESETQMIQDKYEQQQKDGEDALETTLTRLENEADAIRINYEKLMTEQALADEARLLMTSQNNEEIMRLLQTYNPRWQDVGQSFGESLVNGLKSMGETIRDAIMQALGLMPTEAEKANSELIASLQSLSGQFEAIGHEEGQLYVNALIAQLRTGKGTVGAEAASMLSNMDKIFQILNLKMQYAVAKTQAERDAIAAQANAIRATLPAELAAIIGSNVSLEQALTNITTTLATGVTTTPTTTQTQTTQTQTGIHGPPYTDSAGQQLVTSRLGVLVAGDADYVAARLGAGGHYATLAELQAAGMQYGVNFYRRGTSNALSGWALVGEQGPEFVNFRGGERVMNARDTVKAREITLNVYCNRPSDIKAATEEGELLVNRLRMLGGVT